MHRTPATGSSDDRALPPPGAETLHVVIAFGDLGAYRSALRMLVRMVHQLGDDIDLRPLPWPFDALTDAESRAVALADAQRAQLVIVASTATVVLPTHVQQWVEACCQHRVAGEPLLIGLLGEAATPSQDVADSLALLRQAAAHGGWQFLSSHAIAEAGPRRAIPDAT